MADTNPHPDAPAPTGTGVSAADGISTKDRFLAAFVGQGMGILLLILVGWLPFSVYPTMPPEDQQVIAVGLGMVKITFAALLIILVVTFIPAIRFRRKYKTFEGLPDGYVTKVIWIYLLVDMFFLLFLVCQQGGLCYSVFLPIFFLLPIAYWMVERSDRMYRLYWVLILVIGCVIISYLQTKFVTHNNLKALPLPGISIPVTNFQLLVHKDYDYALLLVTIISALIPFVQQLLLNVPFKLPFSKG